jgi:hypothetical protein
MKVAGRQLSVQLQDLELTLGNLFLSGFKEEEIQSLFGEILGQENTLRFWFRKLQAPFPNFT